MSIFAGNIVVVTGFEKADRAELEAKLAAAGATVTHSVSVKTQVLITGPTPGPDKVERARLNDAKILDEATARAALAE